MHSRPRGPARPGDPETTFYARDFGDGFHVDELIGLREVEILGRGGDRVGLVSGEGNCPPEDCGGAPGYEELLAAAAGRPRPAEVGDEVGGPDAEWLEMLRLRAADIRAFDLDSVDDVVRRSAGVVPDSVRLLLDLTADGVKLTPGGRLLRVLVRQVQERRPDWNLWGKPASVEEDLLPLWALSELLRRVGVRRVAKGATKPVGGSAGA